MSEEKRIDLYEVLQPEDGDTALGVKGGINQTKRLALGNAASKTTGTTEDQIPLNSDLPASAKSGSYNDLVDQPNLQPVATSGDYDDLTNKPSLQPVATSGSYDDLVNQPTLLTKGDLAVVADTGDYNSLFNTPNLADVATSGDYNDLSNAPLDVGNFSLGTNIIRTVGPSGADYTTINGALAELSSYIPLYKKAGIKATIRLLDGFVMNEQVLVNDVDLGWISIENAAGSSPVTIQSFVQGSQIAGTNTQEITRFTLSSYALQTTDILNSRYVILVDSNTNYHYFWFSNGDGTDPGPISITVNENPISVSSGYRVDTTLYEKAASVAEKLADRINLLPAASVAYTTGQLVMDITSGSWVEENIDQISFSGSTLTFTDYIVGNEVLNGNYITLQDGGLNDYYYWFNVNGLATDPVLSGTGVEIVIPVDYDNTQVIQEIQHNIDRRIFIENTFNLASTSDTKSILLNNGNALIVYQSAATGDGSFLIVDQDGNEVVAETTFNAGTTSNFSLEIFTNGDVLIAFSDGSNLGYLSFIILDQDGVETFAKTAITAQTVSDVNASRFIGSANDTILISYTPTDTSFIRTQGINPDGSISIADAQLLGVASDYLKTVSLNNGNISLFYSDQGNANYGSFQIIDISRTIIVGETVFNDTDTVIFDAYKMSNNNVIVLYNDVTNTSANFVIYDQDGNEVITETAFNDNNLVNSANATTLSDGSVLVSYSDTGNLGHGEFINLDVSGNEIKTPTAFNIADTEGITSAVFPGNNKPIIVYGDIDNAETRYAIVDDTLDITQNLTDFNASIININSISIENLTAGSVADATVVGDEFNINTTQQGTDLLYRVGVNAISHTYSNGDRIIIRDHVALTGFEEFDYNGVWFVVNAATSYFELDYSVNSDAFYDANRVGEPNTAETVSPTPVTVKRDALTQQWEFFYYPAFGVARGVLPYINCEFTMDTSGTNGYVSYKDGLCATDQGRINLAPFAGFTNAGASNIYGTRSSIINANDAIANNAGRYGIWAYANTIINARRASANNCGWVALDANNYVSIPGGDTFLTNNGFDTNGESVGTGIIATRGSLINASGCSVSNCVGPNILAEHGGTINLGAHEAGEETNIGSSLHGLSIDIKGGAIFREDQSFNVTTITETSSLALKTNLVPIEGALEKILGLKGWIYDRIGGQKNEPGFIAEEVVNVIPNVVSKVDDDIYGIQYTKIIAYLVESVKTLKQEIDELRGN